MLLSHDVRLQDPGGGFQRIHRRIDSLFHNFPGEYRRRVQMGEGGGRSRIRQIIRRNIHGLHRSNTAVFRRGDPLLQLAHFRRQGRLVSDGRGHPAQKGGNLAARLDITENIIDK